MVGGNIIYTACQWGMLSGLAKLGSPTMVGQFALALAVTAPLFLFADLNLRSIQATDTNGDFRFLSYSVLRLVTTILACLASVIVVNIGSYPSGTKWAILFVALGKGFDALSDVFYGLFQQREQMYFVARSLIFNGTCSLTAFLVVLYTTESLIASVAGASIASGLNFLFVVLPVGVDLAGTSLRNVLVHMPSWTPHLTGLLFVKAFPLGMVMLLISLRNSVPRYFIDALWGSEELGVFAALSYLIVAGTTVVSALAQATSPKLARLYMSGQLSLFKKRLGQLMLLGMSVGVAGALISALFGRELVTTLYTEEYGSYVQELIILSLSGGILFAGSFANFGMIATRLFALQIPMFSAVVAVTVVSSLLLIPSSGLMGAAYTIGIAALAQLLGSLWIIYVAIKRSQSLRLDSL